MLANRRQDVGAPQEVSALPDIGGALSLSDGCKITMTIRWTHITINASNLDVSVEFYTSFCGLSIVRDRRLEGRHNVWLGPPTPPGEDPVFVLVIVQDEVKARLDHFGFQCDSRGEVDRIVARARQQDILVQPPLDAGGVVGYFAMVRDPDGHIVEFTFGQPLRGL